MAANLADIVPSQIEQEGTPGVWLASWGTVALNDARSSGVSAKFSLVGMSGGQRRALSLRGEPGRALPAFARSASSAVIFDGVIYNRSELKNWLAGSVPATANDAELVLAAYQRLREKVLEKIKGVFALIVCDGDALLCARDHFGIYPLFYADTGHEFLFSPSIEELIRHPGISSAVNPIVLAKYLMKRMGTADETFFEKVKRLPPSHALRVTNSNRQVYRYWNLPLPGDGGHLAEEDEVARFDQLMEQAVSRGAELGPAGIFLSGGLDSASVAAFAADNSRRQGMPVPWALSLNFPEPCSEDGIQRDVAAKLGLPQLAIPLDEAVGSQGQLLAALQLSSQLSAPLIFFWLPAYVHLGREAKRRGCDVIMTGAGGDDWLTVGPRYASDLLREGNVRGLYKMLASSWRSYKHTPYGLLRYVLWKEGVRPLMLNARANLLRSVAPTRWQRRQHHRIETYSEPIPDWIAPDPVLRRELNEHFLAERKKKLDQTRSGPDGYYWKVTRSYVDHPHLTMVKEENFQTYQRIGIRQHLPFWDFDIVNLLARTPPALLNKGGRSKGLVREMLASRFPELGFDRQKKLWGYNLFQAVLLKEGAKARQMMNGTPTLAKLGVVDEKILSSSIENILANDQPKPDVWRLWSSLNLEAWLRARF